MAGPGGSRLVPLARPHRPNGWIGHRPPASDATSPSPSPTERVVLHSRVVQGHPASIHERIASSDLDVAALAEYLGSLGGETRVTQVRSLGKGEQARLFEAAAGVRPIGLEHFVPPGAAPLAEVVHAGRNSLPAFRIFEKRCCRPAGDGAAGQELWGYNEHGAMWMTGPGYFTAVPGEPGEVLFDYTRVPPAKPDAWPAIASNDAFRGRFVYGRGMADVVRGVSDHVAIGRASRGGKPMDNWFVLCRIDPA